MTWPHTSISAHGPDLPQLSARSRAHTHHLLGRHGLKHRLCSAGPPGHSVPSPQGITSSQLTSFQFNPHPALPAGEAPGPWRPRYPLSYRPDLSAQHGERSGLFLSVWE